MLRRSIALLVLAAPLSLHVQTRAQMAAPTRSTAFTNAGERRASAAFDHARKAGPLALHAFLEAMPKGADLHMHLSGAVYAETFLKDAVDDRACIDTVKLAIVPNTGLHGDGTEPMCAAGAIPAAMALSPKNPGQQKLYDAMVDAMSMRAFVPAQGIDGHDQFFQAFEHWNGLNPTHAGEWLDEVATRAAAQNEQYLEVMQTPSFSNAAKLGYAIGWPSELKPETTAASSEPDDVSGTSVAELSALREKLLASGLRDEVATDRKQLDGALAERSRLEHCGTPQALPACSVKIEFLYQILRAHPPQQVFAQTLLGFEVAAADPDVLGLNFVQPEDAYMAMTEYSRQMRMLDYLHSVYPKVHISLHAGELAPGMVPPAGLRFHIREAVDLGHAERIGHGVDAMYEADSAGLLKELSAKHVMIEINLTSNAVILGVVAPNHPLPDYRAAHVPVSLNTDDEGVSRIDLTHEYVTAATEFGLDYRELKEMARTGLEHTFLPGESLWARPDDFLKPVKACASWTLGAESPTGGCGEFLKANPHAAEQWELERRFRVFEASVK
jgi:adenosine deaminase